MKKILLTCLAAMGLVANANAQLADGSVFPNFVNRYDINNMPHTLYNDLNAGKTVIIDVSATWCGPCWSYHLTGALDSMWSKHGPAGATGVNAGTTDDMVIYFVQGEPTSGMAELTLNTIGTGAVTSGGTYATFTQGNWVAGTHYYIIDDSTAQSAYNASWDINYFPTVYMICRDHLVMELTQPTEAEAYAAAMAVCPSYPPSGTVDAKAVPYSAVSDYYVCTATPSVKFQNYGANTITSATVTVKDASGATVATVPWTGSVASYSVATVAIPSFTGTSLSGYKFVVTTAGDTYPANDVSADSLFKIYNAANAGTIPATEDFTGPGLSYKYGFNTPDGNIAIGYFSGQVSYTGSPAAFIFRNYYASNGTVQTFVFGNFNTSAATGVNLQFDVAYAKSAAADNDKLEVKISTNCGSSWSTAWSQSGTTLVTGPTTTSEWHPTAASQWKHVSVNLTSAVSTNLMVEFVNTSGYGNDIYFDNVNLSTSVTGVPQVVADNEMTIAPNPAKDMANISLTLIESATVQVQVLDAVGRVVNTISKELNAGTQKIELSTANLAAGLYNVKVTTNGSMIVKQLSVIK